MNKKTKNLKTINNLNDSFSLSDYTNIFESFTISPLNLTLREKENETIDDFVIDLDLNNQYDLMNDQDEILSEETFLGNKRYSSNDSNEYESVKSFILRNFVAPVNKHNFEWEENDCFDRFNISNTNSSCFVYNINRIQSSGINDESLTEQFLNCNNNTSPNLGKDYSNDSSLDFFKINKNINFIPNGVDGLETESFTDDGLTDKNRDSISNKISIENLYKFKKTFDLQTRKRLIFKNIRSIKAYENADLEDLYVKFSTIYQKKIKKELKKFFETKGSKVSEKTITDEMKRKDELDKKVNTIMKTVIQIIINLLFTYDNLNEISTSNNDKFLLKKITLKSLTKKKVDVVTLRNFHNRTLTDICKSNSHITNKKLKNSSDEEFKKLLITEELCNKPSFNIIFNMKFEVLLNLIFLEFSENNFDEIKMFLSDYTDEDPGKENYIENLNQAFYTRLTYLTSKDIVANNKGNEKKKKWRLFTVKKEQSNSKFSKRI